MIILSSFYYKILCAGISTGKLQDAYAPFLNSLEPTYGISYYRSTKLLLFYNKYMGIKYLKKKPLPTYICIYISIKKMKFLDSGGSLGNALTNISANWAYTTAPAKEHKGQRYIRK